MKKQKETQTCFRRNQCKQETKTFEILKYLQNLCGRCKTNMKTHQNVFFVHSILFAPTVLLLLLMKTGTVEALTSKNATATQIHHGS